MLGPRVLGDMCLCLIARPRALGLVPLSPDSAALTPDARTLLLTGTVLLSECLMLGVTAVTWGAPGSGRLRLGSLAWGSRLG